MKKEFPLVCIFFLFLFLILSLVSYMPLADFRYFHTFQSDSGHNLFGSAGAWVAGTLVGIFGVGALWTPLALFFCLPASFRGESPGGLATICLGGILTALSLGGFLSLFRDGYALWGSYYNAGGIAGDWLTRLLVQYFNISGTVIVFLFLMLLGVVLTTTLSFSLVGWGIYQGSSFVLRQLRRFAGHIALSFWGGAVWVVHAARTVLFRMDFRGRGMTFNRRLPSMNLTRSGADFETGDSSDKLPVLLHASEHSASKKSFPGDNVPVQDKTKKTGPLIVEPSPVDTAVMSTPAPALFKRDRGFVLPAVSLLREQKKSNTTVDRRGLRDKGAILENKLKDFGISGAVVEILPGPVITTFEYRPAPGVKISKIVNLSDDLALALSALSIRIIAPIPGKDVVGVEIPNETRETVLIRELISSKIFFESASRLTLGLGRDILGTPMVAPMESMPHLLIAGATGTGKSVGLNAMIISLLYKATPDEVKFIMVDPKRIELSVYDGIPHLISPVVTDMKKATNALFWAVSEMERRYELLADNGVRNLLQFNQLVEKNQKDPDIQRGSAVENEADDGNDADASVSVPLEKLPYIVVIVDEFADLMMVASRDVESALIRLAQMARAAGIHLILATQRPSVDVLTGVIKANFPTRISFQVSSRVDSRTILDSNGAETLLGNGDMLFMPPGTGRLTRIQGAYISEAEISRVTTFLKKQQPPSYVEAVTEKVDGVADGNAETEYDEKYDEAVALVTRTRTASISSVQRHLRIGYNRAARIIETMEQEGLIGPQEGSKPREILVKSLEN